MDLEARLARLEAESQIRQLIARYGFAIDDRRMDEIASLFTEDATLRSEDGVMDAAGVGAIMRQFVGRFEALGPGAHYMHDVQIDFVGDGRDEAHGRVSGHAELARNGEMMVCALRYRDIYRNTSAGWRIRQRVIGFLYYVAARDYPGVLLTADRNRAYAEPKKADFPESLPTWDGWRPGR